MQIERFDFIVPGSDKPGTVGLNIQKRYGQTFVNLFVLPETLTHSIAGNLWGISRQIAADVFDSQKTEDFEWTLTAGFSTTHLRFEKHNGSPYALSLSNVWAARTENLFLTQAQHGHIDPDWRLEKYMADYEGQPPVHISDRTPSCDFGPDAEPVRIFAVPTRNPLAKDGVFYCEEPLRSGRLQDREYILVDPQKLWAKIHQDSPRMAEHAHYKGPSSGEWQLGHSSIINPQNLRLFFVYNENVNFADRRRGDTSPKLTLVSGNASMMITAQNMGLAFIPIEVQKHDRSHLDGLIREIGFIQQRFTSAPDPEARHFDW